MFLWTPLALTVVTLAVIAGITRFQTGTQSTAMQRGFIMSWAVLGNLFGVLSGVIYCWAFLLVAELHKDRRLILWPWVLFLFVGCVFSVLVTFVPSLGGMVIVGQMISEYGDCTRI